MASTFSSCVEGLADEPLALLRGRSFRLDVDFLALEQPLHCAGQVRFAHAAIVRMLREHRRRVGGAWLGRHIAPLGREQGEQVEKDALGLGLGGELVEPAGRAVENE